VSPTKKKIKSPLTIEFYVIEITDWKYSYSISLNDQENLKDIFGPGLYREHCSLKLSGVFLEPKKITEKDLKISIFASRDMVEVLNKPEDFPRASAKGVGGLTVRGKTREYYGSIPQDIFTVTANMFAAGKIRYLTMLGETLYRGNALIHSIHFEEDYDREDTE
jgi:hypothetical protein